MNLRVRGIRLILPIVLAVAGAGACSRPPDGRTRKPLRVTGTVLEQMDGPPYSYLRLKTEAGEVWAMVPVTRIGVDERVTISDGVLLKDFETGIGGRRLDVVMGALQPR
jgi:hypothetical protein